jgi:hypothetical protein
VIEGYYDVNVPVPERCWCGALLVVLEEFEIDESDLEAQVAAGLDPRTCLRRGAFHVERFATIRNVPQPPATLRKAGFGPNLVPGRPGGAR